MPIEWNKNVKLILSDVDETLADLYVPCAPEMSRELEKILDNGIALFLISGQSLESIRERVVLPLRPGLRKRVLIAHCSGAEVWGFDSSGELLTEPFYSLYRGALTTDQQKAWRTVCESMIREYHLTTHPNMILKEFAKVSKGEPLTVMFEDRGPQITFEFVNAIHLTAEQRKHLAGIIPSYRGEKDLRVSFMNRIEELLFVNHIPVTPRAAGEFAVDLALEGASKATAVRKVLSSSPALSHLGLPQDTGSHPGWMEVWGDKFSVINGGTDRHILEALPTGVRAIDFREEESTELPKDAEIVLWNGKNHLHHGALEYLKSCYS